MCTIGSSDIVGHCLHKTRHYDSKDGPSDDHYGGDQEGKIVTEHKKIQGKEKNNTSQRPVFLGTILFNHCILQPVNLKMREIVLPVIIARIHRGLTLL